MEIIFIQQFDLKSITNLNKIKNLLTFNDYGSNIDLLIRRALGSQILTRLDVSNPICKVEHCCKYSKIHFFLFFFHTVVVLYVKYLKRVILVAIFFTSELITQHLKKYSKNDCMCIINKFNNFEYCIH